MRTMKVNTATRESDEQFKTDKYLRSAVTNGKARLGFIPELFFTVSRYYGRELVTPAF